MKTHLLFVFALLGQFSMAQTFTEVPQSFPFEGVANGAIAFADVDGDNDQDVLITGSGSPTKISKLYTNDGSGNFTEVIGTPFEGVEYSSIAFADLDSDNDLDVLITGRNSSYVKISKLYMNDGSGNFAEVTGTPFEGVEFGSIALADVDGDNDTDVLITGENSSSIPISKLYTNDGPASSIDDFGEIDRFDFSLFPNPTHDHTLNIRYGSIENTWVTARVFDLEGRLLGQELIRSVQGQQAFSIDISSLARGIYILQLEDGKRKGAQKFLVR